MYRSIQANALSLSLLASLLLAGLLLRR